MSFGTACVEGLGGFGSHFPDQTLYYDANVRRLVKKGHRLVVSRKDKQGRIVGGMSPDLPTRAEDDGSRDTTPRHPSWTPRWGLAASLLVVASVYGLLLLSYQPCFDTNDDAGMMSIVSGLYDGDASPHLVITHVSIGVVLKALYSLAPSVPWYALYLYGFQVLSWALILHGLVMLRSGWLAAAFFCGTFLFFGLPLAMRLQFTSTAILLGTAAIFYFLAVGRQAASWRIPVFTGLLLGAAGLVRERALQLSVLTWGPLFAVLVTRTPARRTLLFATATLALVLCAAATDHAVYHSDPRWREFREFNAVRGRLHGNRALRPDPAALAKLGWSANDFVMFSSWFFTDRDIYSTEHLRALYASLATPAKLLILYPQIELFVSRNGARLVACFAIALVLLLGADRRRALLILSVSAWFVLGAAAIIFHFGRIHPRVSIPLMLSGLLALALASGLRNPSLRAEGLRQRIALAAALLAVLAGVHRAIPELRTWTRESNENLTRSVLLRRELARLHAFDPDGVFVHWPGSLDLKRMPPLLDASGLPRARLILLGWRTNSPPWLDSLHDLGIEDLYLAIVRQRNVYLLCSRTCRRTEVRAFTRFVLEHHGISITMRRRCLDERCRLKLWSPLPAPGDGRKLGRSGSRGTQDADGFSEHRPELLDSRTDGAHRHASSFLLVAAFVFA